MSEERLDGIPKIWRFMGVSRSYFCRKLKPRMEKSGILFTRPGPYQVALNDKGINAAAGIGQKFTVAPKLGRESGIEQVRRILGICRSVYQSLSAE